MPTQRRGVALALAVLVVLAGCSAFSPGDGQRGGTPTLTPAPVPVDEVTGSDGVRSGTIDAGTIARNHRVALANASYTAAERLRVGAEGNATFRLRTRAFVAPEQRAFRVERNASVARLGSPDRVTDVWWNGDRAYYRYSPDGDGEAYYSGDNAPRLGLRTDARLRDLLETLSVSSVEPRQGGAVVVAGSIDDPAVVPQTVALRSIENATMTIRIRPGGVIDRMAVGYDATYRDEGRFHVRYTYRVTDVGTTAVDPPPWIDEFDDDRR